MTLECFDSFFEHGGVVAINVFQLFIRGCESDKLKERGTPMKTRRDKKNSCDFHRQCLPWRAQQVATLWFSRAHEDMLSATAIRTSSGTDKIDSPETFFLGNAFEEVF